MSREGNPERGRLVRDWQAQFDCAPPARLFVPIMKAALNFEAQCKQFGGHKRATLRQLKAMAYGRPAVSQPNLQPGACLVREWNGRTYRVDVVDGGFVMDGRTWSSLSALAKHITGTAWSGPRFFGLTNRKGQTP